VDLVLDAESLYNQKLVALLDQYLASSRLDCDDIRQTMRNLLQRRSVPTMQNIATDLALRTGQRLTQSHIGLVLQLLGYAGVLGMARNRDQVFFPWTSGGRDLSAMVCP
jgi:hypothetical protein